VRYCEAAGLDPGDWKKRVAGFWGGTFEYRGVWKLMLYVYFHPPRDVMLAVPASIFGSW